MVADISASLQRFKDVFNAFKCWKITLLSLPVLVPCVGFGPLNQCTLCCVAPGQMWPKKVKECGSVCVCVFPAVGF